MDEKKLSYTAEYLNVTPVKYQPDEKISVKARPNSVSARYVEDKVVQYRLYNNEGHVLVDFDLTNHGNPKHHKVVPHKHEWNIIKSENGVKYKRSKDPNVPLTDEELELVKGWREYDN